MAGKKPKIPKGFIIWEAFILYMEDSWHRTNFTKSVSRNMQFNIICPSQRWPSTNFLLCHITKLGSGRWTRRIVCGCYGWSEKELLNISQTPSPLSLLCGMVQSLKRKLLSTLLPRYPFPTQTSHLIVAVVRYRMRTLHTTKVMVKQFNVLNVEIIGRMSHASKMAE